MKPADNDFVCVFTVQQSAELVSRAKKPVIVLGSQATLPPVPADQLRTTLEVRVSVASIKFMEATQFYHINFKLNSVLI